MDNTNRLNIDLDRRIIILKGSKAKLEQIINRLNETNRNWLSLSDDASLTIEELNFTLTKINEELEAVELQKTKNNMLSCKHLFITVLWPKIGECFDEEIACVKCGFDTRMKGANIPIGQIIDEVYLLNGKGTPSNIYCNNLSLAQNVYHQVKNNNPKMADERIWPILDEQLLKEKQKIKS